jgi:hypothetical protein
MMEDYREVFEKLRLLDPLDYDMNIILSEYDCDIRDANKTSTYVDVSGRKKEHDPDSISNSYALEFLEWEKWLGMDLASETVKDFSELEIIAHYLNEMTFLDFNEEEIRKQFERISNIADEYKSSTNEEKKQKTSTFEELLKKQNNKGCN